MLQTEHEFDIFGRYLQYTIFKDFIQCFKQQKIPSQDMKLPNLVKTYHLFFINRVYKCFTRNYINPLRIPALTIPLINIYYHDIYNFNKHVL